MKNPYPVEIIIKKIFEKEQNKITKNGKFPRINNFLRCSCGKKIVYYWSNEVV